MKIKTKISFKKWKISIGKDMDKLKPAYIANVNINGVISVENNFVVPQKSKLRVNI